MTKRKFWRVTVHETRALDYIIEAASADAARDLAMQGEFDSDPVRDEGLDVEITRVAPEKAGAE